MALIENFFNQVAVITPFIRDGGGEPIYGESETRKCRLERGKFLRRGGSADGTIDELIGNARMFCVGDPIPARSFVACEGQEFTVIDCAVKNGFLDHHLEVALQ